MAIGAARNVSSFEGVHIHVQQFFQCRRPLHATGLVRQPGRAGDIADCIEAFDIGAPEAVIDDMAAIHFRAQAFQTEICGIARDADGQNDLLDLDDLRPCPWRP